MMTYLICLPLLAILVYFTYKAIQEFSEMRKIIRKKIEENDRVLEHLTKMNEKISHKS